MGRLAAALHNVQVKWSEPDTNMRSSFCAALAVLCVSGTVQHASAKGGHGADLVSRQDLFELDKLINDAERDDEDEKDDEKKEEKKENAEKKKKEKTEKKAEEGGQQDLMKALMGGMAGGQQGMPGGPGDKKEMSPEDEWKSTLNCGNAMELSNRMAGLASQINEQAVSGLGQVPGFHTTGPLGPVVKKTTKYVPLPAPFAAASNNHVAQEYAKMNYNRFKVEIAAAKKEQEKMKKMQAKQEGEMMKQIMKAMKQSGDKEEKQDTKGGQKKAPEPKK